MPNRPRRSSRTLVISSTIALISLLAGALLLWTPQAVTAAASDVFFSEYIEGSSFNKAIEIYNGTGAPVDLGAGNYVLQLHSNGSATVSQSINLTNIIADGDVLVLAHSSANAAILAQADVLNTSVINWNGDDAVVLRKGGAAGPIVDVIGQIGFDPGTEWGSGLTSTADNTIRRKSTVCAGDTNGADAFDPAIEWDGFANDTSDGLGVHTASCGDPTPTPTATPTPTPSPSPDPSPSPATNVIINEIDSDTPGTDAAEFIELYDGGVGNTPLDGLVVVLFNGNGDVSYNAFDLDGRTTDANGYFVLGNTAVPGVDLVFSGNGLQNGQDAVALYAANATDFPTNTPVSTADLQDAIVYDNGQGDDAGLLVLLNADEPQVNEGGDSNSIGRCPNGSGGARNTSTYSQAAPSPGGPNDCAKPPSSVGNVVISQVYGGGGNVGATLKNDYIELINRSSAPVDLSGWSVQVFSTISSSWEVTPLTNFLLQPGQYYLVQESQGAGGTENLPTPDASGNILVSSTAGRVALVSNSTALTGNCSSSSAIVDFVGYGDATVCFEGLGPAPQLTNTTAALRKNNGCFDTSDNKLDFDSGGPNPRNSSSPTNDCTGISGFGSANPSSVVQGESTILTVRVAPAQNPPSTSITVTADLSQIGGSATQAFSGGPTTFTFMATIPANNSTGMKSLPVTIADGQSRMFNTNIDLTVLPVIADHVTISQLYGGGGNNDATYNHDFVELYNPHTSTFDLTGWSLQYGSATGDTWQVQPLGGSIAPGEYYLIALGTNSSAVGDPLPDANVSSDINMAAAAGKVALVNNFDALAGPCPLGNPGIVDFLGYGTTANCAETARAAAPSNTTALFRKNDGARDSDNNLNDFVTAAPNPRRTAPIVEIGPSVFSTDPRNGATTAPRDATIVIGFTEPVTVDEAWYDITCVSTGNHNSATVRSFFGGDTHTITPNVNFVAGEQCTVTIFKDAIHDVDTDDTGANADSLPADKVFTFTVATGTAPPADSNNLLMGNPNGATTDLGQPDNYLMEKPEFSLSYNKSRGIANWVSWHLSDEWVGTLARVDTFRADPEVPADWFRVSEFDYVSSGFDRGHIVPSADRDKETSIPINQATFLMTNMIPQSPDNNRGPWANLEDYLRTQLPANEIYIIAGGAGTGGTGSNGTATSIAGGEVTVPAQTWKVALVLPKDSGDDVARVDCSARTIAVIMPNIQGIGTNWEDYLTTVDAVEALTGYDFFSNLPDAVENCVEAGNNGTNPPGTDDQSATTPEDTPVEITLEAVRSSDTTPLTFSIVSNPTEGSLGSIGSPSCVALECTATVTYTPGSNYNGSDSFTFKVNDGTVDSNTSTVSITVSPVNDAPVLTSSVAMTLISSTNSNLFNVGLTASATDQEDEDVTIQVAVFGDEDDETATLPGVVHSPDAKDIAPETLRLRGERVEANDGRVYLIIVTATDTSGGISRNYHTVVVPKNNKPANIDLVNAEATAAAAYAESNGTPPPGYFVIGDGLIIGPKQ